MGPEFTRKEFTLGSISVFLLGCSSRAPIPAVEKWPEMKVRGSRNVTVIENTADILFPQIGLKQLFFVSDGRSSLVSICTIWEKQLVKTKRSSQFQLEGNIGFQQVTDPFDPEPITVVETGLNESELIQTTRISFGILDRIMRGKLGENTYGFITMARPEEQKRWALVFDENLVEYRGQPSSRAFLAVKLYFEPPRKSEDNLLKV